MTVALGRPTVRPATVEDLPAIERHMRAMLVELGGHDPRFHADVDDLAGAYLDQDDRVLLVSYAEDGTVAGTASVRPGGPQPEYVPHWLAARYASASVGQVCRVWVAPSARRGGVGRTLARAAVNWAVARFDIVCLHTNASVPGALAFWRSFPGLVEVFDARPDPWSTVHFEVAPPGEQYSVLQHGSLLTSAQRTSSPAAPSAGGARPRSRPPRAAPTRSAR